MKKLLSLVLSVLLLLTSVAIVGCVEKPSGDGDPYTGNSIHELISNQAHEEKFGYKFCGYFEDKDFTTRVMKTFDTIPTGYYAKYQLDRAQLNAFKYEMYPYCDYNQAEEYLQMPEMTLDQVIYAYDYDDAVGRYELITYNDDSGNNGVGREFHREQRLGKDFDSFDYLLGCKDKNRFYNFHDELGLSYRYDVPEGMGETPLIKRNTKWRCYIGEPTTTEEGLMYYIVDNSYAVVVGIDNENRIENLNIPSELGGKPVKHVSMYLYYYTVDIGIITVPSTVETASIMYSEANHKVIDKIIFSEGVKTIQAYVSRMTDIVIPSTAHTVDINEKYSVIYAPYELLYAKDQEITLNNNQHYYTKDGILYSVEGDLLYQFGNRDKLNLHIDDKAVRVLPRSINGAAKNIYIPESVQFFDLWFNDISARFIQCRRTASTDIRRVMPIFFVNSQKVAEQFIYHYVNHNKILETYMKNEFKFAVSKIVEMQYKLFKFADSIDYMEMLGQEISEACSELLKQDGIDLDAVIDTLISNDMIYKIEGNQIKTKKYDVMTSQFLDEWIVISYLTEDYPSDFSEIILDRYKEFA